MIRQSLRALRFDDDVEHIEVGRDCAAELKLLKKIATLKQTHNNTVHEEKKLKAKNEEKPACCGKSRAVALEEMAKARAALEDKIGEECGMLAEELITPSFATGPPPPPDPNLGSCHSPPFVIAVLSRACVPAPAGQAIVTFKTEKRRDEFVKQMFDDVGIFGSKYNVSRCVSTPRLVGCAARHSCPAVLISKLTRSSSTRAGGCAPGARAERYFLGEFRVRRLQVGALCRLHQLRHHDHAPARLAYGAH
eukprot:1724533-Prymnesium_polylepis.1